MIEESDIDVCCSCWLVWSPRR